MIKKNIFYVVLIAMTLGFSTPSFGIETTYESGYTMEKSQVNTNKKEDGEEFLHLLTLRFAMLCTICSTIKIYPL